MSKKKQKGNGFFIFMREMQQEFRERGKIVSMKDMPILAGPKWAQLPDAKKQAYQILARRERQGGGGAMADNGLNPPFLGSPPHAGKMDSTGMPLSVSEIAWSCMPVVNIPVIKTNLIYIRWSGRPTHNIV